MAHPTMKSAGPASARLPTDLCRERAARWALFRTVRDLRLSVARGRPVSLPNLLRLYCRRTDALGVHCADLNRIRAIYLLNQPFREFEFSLIAASVGEMRLR